MIDTVNCPSHDDLQRLLARDCDAAIQAQLRRHLAECASCFQKLSAMSSQENVPSSGKFGNNPSATPSDALREPPDEAVVDSEFRDATMSDMTPPPVPKLRTPTSATSPTKLDFLRPKQQPDELGRLAGYRVLSVLGTGGMGVVLKAQDVSLKRLVALKVMKPLLAAHETAGKRFIREAQSAAAINHENVVRIYQVGEDNGVPYLAMELLEGETLDAIARRAGRLSLAETLRIGRQVAAGLAAAHRRGLIHRDIKPGNIVLEPIDPTEEVDRTVFLSRSSGSGLRAALSDSGEMLSSQVTSETSSFSDQPRTTKVKLVDFGLARATDEDSQLTQSGLITGTPQYMSPEQAEGVELDHRSDLFSLGCVLYRILAGVVPFKQRGNTALMRAIVEKPHAPLKEIIPNIPSTVEQIVDRLLAKNPADRFQSAVEVMEALAQIERRLLGGQSLDDDAPASPSLSSEHTASMTFYNLHTPRSVNGKPSKSSRLAAMFLGVMLAVGLAMGWSHWQKTKFPDAAQKHPSSHPLTGSSQQAEVDKAAVGDVPTLIPVEEWLKGREVLTVSQDGRGQFKSITDALQALKPGQVVKVLDQGPYREKPFNRSVPSDTGLVSFAGTRVELTEYLSIERKPDESVQYCQGKLICLVGSVAQNTKEKSGFV